MELDYPVLETDTVPKKLVPKGTSEYQAAWLDEEVDFHSDDLEELTETNEAIENESLLDD